MAGACELERTPQLIDGSAAGDLLISLQLTGLGTVQQNGRAATMSAGTGALYKTDEPYRLSFPTDTVSLVTQLSTERLGLGSATITEVERDRVALISGELLRFAVHSHPGSATRSDAPTQLAVPRHFIHEQSGSADRI